LRPTVLLFDIDGTLITTGGAGKRAVLRAVLAWAKARGLTLGPESSAFSFGGMTDRAIVRRILVEAGAPPTDDDIDALLEHYLNALEQEVAGALGTKYQVLPGVTEVLDAVSDRAGIAVGLGTGNVERGARVKLAHVDLAARFAFGGFGCDAEERPALLHIGASRGAARLGLPLEDCRVVVIGDTFRDIAAAHAIGADCLAVATGGEPLESLREHRPRWAVPSLTDPSVLRALLDPNEPKLP